MIIENFALFLLCMEKENLIDIFNKCENKDESVDILANYCLERYSDGDLNEAAKYAAIATICTESPRADICCLMGFLYHSIGNEKWAAKWLHNAIGNASAHIDSGYYTWYPLVLLANVETNKAEEYFKAAELINPNYIKDLPSFPF